MCVCVCLLLYVFLPIIILITFLSIITAKTLAIRHCGLCLLDIGWAVCDELFVLGGVGPLAGCLTGQAGASCGERLCHVLQRLVLNRPSAINLPSSVGERAWAKLVNV